MLANNVVFTAILIVLLRAGSALTLCSIVSRRTCASVKMFTLEQWSDGKLRKVEAVLSKGATDG